MDTRCCTFTDEQKDAQRFNDSGSGSQSQVRFDLSVSRKKGLTTSALVLALFIFFGTATAQLSTRNPSPTAPSGDVDPAAEDPSQAIPEAGAVTEDGSVEAAGNTMGAQLLLQIEQLLAELERLNTENKRLKSQLEVTAAMQEDELAALRRENALMKEQLDAARTSQGSNSAVLPFQANEAEGPEDQMQDQNLVAAQNQSQQTGVAQDNQDPELVSEISELQPQVQRINDEHAMLLEQPDGALLKTEGQPTEQQTHVVQPGDSLSKLAKAYYGTGSRWPEILAANPSMSDPNRLITGTTLVIP